MLVDTHCHLNAEAYAEDRAAVIARAQMQGVTRVIIPATELESGEEARILAEQHTGIYFAVGFHPNSTASATSEDLERVESQAAHPKVVAIGEIGLDYYRDWSPKAQQWTFFEAQLALASKLNLPIIIHNREATDDVIALLANWVPTLPPALREHPGVMHSFSAPRAAAERVVELGFYLGFTGPITYKNANDLRLIAAAAPLDRLLIETDGPYLTPVPHRGERNEPAYVTHVADRLASLRNLDLAEIAALTTANAERLFTRMAAV